MLDWIYVALVVVFDALLIYRMVRDRRRWEKQQAQWNQRIQDNWAHFIEAAQRERDSTADHN